MKVLYKLLVFAFISLSWGESNADSFTGPENLTIECYEMYNTGIRNTNDYENLRLDSFGCFLPAFQEIRTQHWKLKKCWKIYDKQFMYKCSKYNDAYKVLVRLLSRDATRKGCYGDKVDSYFCLLSKRHSNYFMGERCSSDCSGHKAGYEWAEKEELYDESDCENHSQSFENGCMIYVELYGDDNRRLNY